VKVLDTRVGETRLGLAYGGSIPAFIAANPGLMDYLELPFEQLLHTPALAALQDTLPFILHCASLSIAGFLRRRRARHVRGRPGDPATVYWIDPGVHAIAELFVEPRTCGEVAELVCAAVGLPALASGVFEGLIRAGLLVAPAAHAP
jgi:hypothetical protein